MLVFFVYHCICLKHQPFNLADFLYVNLALFFYRVSALKGSKGKDCEIPVPLGISITDENGKIIGKCIVDSKVVKNVHVF